MSCTQWKYEAPWTSSTKLRLSGVGCTSKTCNYHSVWLTDYVSAVFLSNLLPCQDIASPSVIRTGLGKGMSRRSQLNSCQGHSSAWNCNYKSHRYLPKNKGQAENEKGNKEMAAVSSDIQLFCVRNRSVLHSCWCAGHWPWICLGLFRILWVSCMKALREAPTYGITGSFKSLLFLECP